MLYLNTSVYDSHILQKSIYFTKRLTQNLWDPHQPRMRDSQVTEMINTDFMVTWLFINSREGYLMRELLFKNMTSLKKKRKALCIQEIKSQKGFLTRINRKYIYILKNKEEATQDVGSSEVFIIKERNSKEHLEKMLFKVKGSFYVTNSRAKYLVNFCHSLTITLYPQGTKTPKSQH